MSMEAGVDSYEQVKEYEYDSVSISYVHLQKQCNHDLLSKVEVGQLFEKINCGEDREARNRVMECNHKLVISIAKRYLWSKLDFCDLVQEGSIGLLEAIKRFNYRNGGSFATYATFWIKNSIQFAIAEHNQNVRLPTQVFYARNKILRSIAELEICSQGSPTLEDISRYTNKSVTEVQRLLHKCNVFEMSFDADFDSDNSRLSLRDIVEDTRFIRTVNLVEGKEELQRIVGEIKQIFADVELLTNTRNTSLFNKRYQTEATDKFRCRTCNSLGEEFGITRERVYQILKTLWKNINKRYSVTHEIFVKDLQRVIELENVLDVDTGIF